MTLISGLLIPFIGTTLGAGMVFTMRNKMNLKIEKLLLRVCIRGNDCSFSMVTIDSINRNGR